MESTPNWTESSPEDGETSEWELEEAPVRLTQQTECSYPTREFIVPQRYSGTLQLIIVFIYNVLFFFKGKECNDYIVMM